jgi:hypothetical protein
MSGAGLHTDDALAAAMRSLITEVGILLAVVFPIFRDATFAVPQCRSGGVFVPIRLALLCHRKSFRGCEDNPPERRFVP